MKKLYFVTQRQETQGDRLFPGIAIYDEAEFSGLGGSAAVQAARVDGVLGSLCKAEPRQNLADDNVKTDLAEAKNGIAALRHKQ